MYIWYKINSEKVATDQTTQYYMLHARFDVQVEVEVEAKHLPSHVSLPKAKLICTAMSSIAMNANFALSDVGFIFQKPCAHSDIFGFGFPCGFKTETINFQIYCLRSSRISRRAPSIFKFCLFMQQFSTYTYLNASRR